VDENTANSGLADLTALSNSGSTSQDPQGANSDDDANNNGKKTRPKGQMPNSRANPNALDGRDEG